MAPVELANLEAMAIRGINRIDLYHKNGSEYYQGSALCRAMVIEPKQDSRFLRLYKSPNDEPNSDDCQEIPFGEKISIEQMGNSLRLRFNEFELNIVPSTSTHLQVSRKSFSSKDAKALEAEVSRYISQCIRDSA